jgi:hypothetical protein
MKEYSFSELGYLSVRDCDALATALNGKSFLNFQVRYSNYAGNCTLIVETDADDYTEEEVKSMFLHVAFTTLAELIRKQNN